jgi:hypothetical protein
MIDTKIDAKTMRESEFYKKMTDYLACAYAEGFCEGEHATQEDRLIAWQWISDTGLWKHLQGFYGRGVASLIQQGLIEKPVGVDKL